MRCSGSTSVTVFGPADPFTAPRESRLGYGALLGRRCRIKLRELQRAIGLPNYAVVTTNSKRYVPWLEATAGSEFA